MSERCDFKWQKQLPWWLWRIRAEAEREKRRREKFRDWPDCRRSR